MKKNLLKIFFLVSSAAIAAEPVTEIQEVTVAAPRIKNSVEALLEIRKQNNNVSDVLGQEAMSRSGDSDAAASLRRVTGLTLVNGKFVYVRGLGERYSSVLLNGSQIPSPEPSRRVVPLDLFPINILESITVQKSFSPDRPAEFGGGLIELQTKSIPNNFSGNFQIGYASESFGSGLGYVGGLKDYLGKDDGTRKMPAEIKNAFLSKKKLIVSENDGFKIEEIERMGKSLSNNYNTKKTNSEGIPNLQINLGDQIKWGQYKAGALFGAIYTSSLDSGDRISRNFNVGNNSKLEKEDESQIEFSEKEIQLGGALNLGLSYRDNHQINLNSILLRNTTDLAQEKITSKNSDSFTSRKYTLFEWSERQLFLNQISSTHQFENFKLKWRINQSTAERISPDTREIMRNFDNGIYVLETDVTGNKRIFSELKDKSREIGVDLEIPIIENNHSKINAKLGASFNDKKRASDIYRLHLKNNYAPGTLPDLSQSTEDILINRSKDTFILTNITDSADSFKGNQNQTSFYSALDSQINEKINFNLGLRLETSVQEVKTFKYYEPDLPTSTGSLKMNDLLPSYTISYAINSDQKIRFVYGETIARPDFRELSTVQYIEDETGYDVIGNSSLKGTVIKNIDLRFENYLADSDFFSAGVFYKKFENPIEAMFQPGDKLIKTFINAPSAYSAGIEIEGRYSLRNVSRELRRWSLTSNLSLIQSKVEIDANSGNQTSKERPLQGQSPYVANFQLFYDRPQLKITSGLIYNVVGRRITEVGTNAKPDVYEEPSHQLDWVFNQKIDDWGYGLKAKNLLDAKSKSTQGDEIVRLKKKGRSYAINLSAYF